LAKITNAIMLSGKYSSFLSKEVANVEQKTSAQHSPQSMSHDFSKEPQTWQGMVPPCRELCYSKKRLEIALFSFIKSSSCKIAWSSTTTRNTMTKPPGEKDALCSLLRMNTAHPFTITTDCATGTRCNLIWIQTICLKLFKLMKQHIAQK